MVMIRPYDALLTEPVRRRLEAPPNLRVAGATLLDLEGVAEFRGWLSRRRLRFLAWTLYRLADKVEGIR
jgi:hypothetical protein